MNHSIFGFGLGENGPPFTKTTVTAPRLKNPSALDKSLSIQRSRQDSNFVELEKRQAETRKKLAETRTSLEALERSNRKLKYERSKLLKWGIAVGLSAMVVNLFFKLRGK